MLSVLSRLPYALFTASPAVGAHCILQSAGRGLEKGTEGESFLLMMKFVQSFSLWKMLPHQYITVHVPCPLIYGLMLGRHQPLKPKISEHVSLVYLGMILLWTLKDTHLHLTCPKQEVLKVFN